jgi:hypothetical protein
MGLSRLGVRVLVRMVVVVGGGIWWMRLPTDVELRCANAAANHWLRPDRIRRNREAAERLPHVLELHAGINQCAEDHVAGGTREAVEIERGQDLQSYQQAFATGRQPRWGIAPTSSSEQYRWSPRMM